MSRFNFQIPGGRCGLPFRELDKMRNHVENFYNSLSGSVANIRKNLGVFPLANLAEDENSLYLTAELPGARPDSLEVSVKGDTLSLRGQVNPTEPGAEVNFHRRERENGSFRRVLNLPVKIDVDRVDATFKNGILTVTMPKTAESKSHNISIKTE